MHGRLHGDGPGWGSAIAEALLRAGVPDQVEYVLMGQVILAGQGQITARQAAAKAGIPMSGPGDDHQQGVPVGPQHRSTWPTR